MADDITVLYCDKCGWHSEPDVFMSNNCPFCRQRIVEFPEDKYPSFLGARKQVWNVPLSYVRGTAEEVNEFIEKNLRMEKNDA